MPAALGASVQRIRRTLAYIVSRQGRSRRLARELRVHARWAIGLG